MADDYHVTVRLFVGGGKVASQHWRNPQDPKKVGRNHLARHMQRITAAGQRHVRVMIRSYRFKRVILAPIVKEIRITEATRENRPAGRLLTPWRNIHNPFGLGKRQRPKDN